MAAAAAARRWDAPQGRQQHRLLRQARRQIAPRAIGRADGARLVEEAEADGRATDIADIERKGRQLGQLFIALVERRCAGLGLTLASPRDPAERGCHVAFRHPHGYSIMRALIERGVIGDFREPDALRFGFAPLYLRYRDVQDAVEILHDVLSNRTWQDARFAERQSVT